MEQGSTSVRTWSTWAFRPCPRGHGTLMWNCLPHLLGNCLGHQPPEDIPGFLEGGHPPQSEVIGDRKWNVGTRQLFCHRKQEVGISHIVQDQSHVLHCHARRSGNGPSSRRTLKVEWHLRNEIQEDSWDRVTRFRLSPLWILECIQSLTVPWCEVGPFQCLLPDCPNPVAVCGASVRFIATETSSDATTDNLQKLGIVPPTCSCGCCPLWQA